MKQDLSKKVMQKVIQAEKRRSFWWLGKLVIIVFGLLAAASIVLTLTLWQLGEQKSWDGLTIFFEDQEIINQYGKDILNTFWTEMPKENLIILIAIIVCLFIVGVVSYRQIKVVRKRLETIFRWKEY